MSLEEPSELWKAGDLVQLRSGGPAMTIRGYLFTWFSGSKFVVCDWFEARVPCEQTFHEDQLVKHRS